MLKAGFRFLKYTIIADVLKGLVRYTPLFDKDIPPEIINFAGHQSFVEVGDLTVKLMELHADLKAGDRVLDIGCAIGRNALALHRHFENKISYAGFDIVPYGIHWCWKRFARLQGDYHFEVTDVYNSFYNPRGQITAEDFRFPYEDNRFDISVATSVYTHMQRPDIERYILETARVTSAGGRAYFTVFGLDKSSREAMAEGKTTFSFKYKGQGTLIEDQKEPNQAVAVDLDWMIAFLTQNGATSVDIHPGYWRGRQGLDFQDIIVVGF